MIDLEKMTKKELIEERQIMQERIDLLEKEVEQNKYLAQAVDAKDLEIATIRKQQEQFVNEKLTKGNALYDTKMKEKEEEVKSMKVQMVNMEKDYFALLSHARTIFERHLSLLKSLQGNLENAVDLSEFSRLVLENYNPKK